MKVSIEAEDDPEVEFRYGEKKKGVLVPRLPVSWKRFNLISTAAP